MSTLITPLPYAAGTPPVASLNTNPYALIQLQGGTPASGEGALDFFTAVQAVAQTGLTTSTFVSITFATEVVDSASGHSTSVNTSRYTPTTAGYYELGGMVAIAGNAGGTRRLAQLALNGTAIGGSLGNVFHGGSTASVAVAIPPGVYQYCNGTTDYIEIQGWADYASWATVISGSAASRLSAKWIHS